VPEYLEHYESVVNVIMSERVKKEMELNHEVTTTYITPDDDRVIQGGDDNLYIEAQVNQEEEKVLTLYDHLSDDDIKTENGREADYKVGMVFGLRTAIGLISLQWRYKEQALKFIQKEMKDHLSDESEIENTIRAILTALDQTICDKVLKVVIQAISVFNDLISA
jgi:hypothetical protein